MPSFRPGGILHGTYSIKDPFNLRNFTRLDQSKLIGSNLSDYGNRYRMARYVTPLVGPGPSGLPANLPVAAGTVRIAILTEGTERIEVVDPLGRRMVRDARSAEDVAEIPDAAIVEEQSEHDNEDAPNDALTGHSIDVGDARDGHYTVRVYANNGYSLTCSAYDETDNLFTAAAGDTTTQPVGRAYDLHYSAATRSASLSFIGPLAVDPITVRPRESRLVVIGNPATEPVRFAIAGKAHRAEIIDVFDILGRRACEIRLEAAQAGAIWDWRGSGERSGMYLARLRGSSVCVRFILLR